MYRRPFPAVALTALLILAGCAVNPLNSTSPSPESPPGVENESLTNESALLEAHQTALRNTAFTRVATENVSEVAPDGSLGWRNSTYRITAGENFTPISGDIRFDAFDRERTQAFWANETVVYWNYNGSYTYRNTTELPVNVSGTSSLQTLLNASSYSVTNTTTQDGHTYVTLTGNDSESYAAFNATVVVDSTGLIHEAHASYDLEGEDQRKRLYTHRLVATDNVTVDPPTWVSEVRE